MGVMMAPSVLGIFTDIVAIFLIALAPIPAMQRFALFCGFWAIWLIPTGVVLISLLLAALPAPRNAGRLSGRTEGTGFQRRFRALLAGIASITFGRRARVTTPTTLRMYSARASTSAPRVTQKISTIWDSYSYTQPVSTG